MKKWYQSKTILTGIAAVIGAAGAYFTGQAAPADALQTATTALIGIFLRTGMLKR